MKKKLLTILLSIVVILTSTVTVLAIDIAKSGDIFNTVDDVTSWTNEHGKAFADLYDYNDLLNQEAESEDGVIYRFSCGNENYALTKYDKLFSIEVSNCPVDDYNGTYMLTIASILPSNFPASAEDNSWCNSENVNVNIYKTDSNLVFYDNTEDCYSVPLYSSLIKEANPTVSYKYSQGEDLIQFNMTGDNGDKLDSIVVNKCTIPTCIGTYNPIEIVTYDVTYNANGATSGSAPANQTKTASVDLTLATNTGNLAKAGYTFAGWNTKIDGSGTHYDTGATYTTDAALTLYAEWIEASATKTIAGILPEDFPVLDEGSFTSDAWTSNNGAQMMRDDSLLYMHNESGGDYVLAITTVLTSDGSNYKYTDNDGVTTTFVMDNDALVSVKAEGLIGDNVNLNGEYYPKTPITPTVSLTGWTYGDNANTPNVKGNTGNGTVTYKYKVKNAEDTTYTETKPTKAGSYVVKAEVAETTDYLAGSATCEFTISQRQLIAKGTTVKDKAYDGKTTGQVNNIGSLANVVTGDNVLIDEATVTYANANAGVNKPVTVQYTIKGDDASNYKKPVDNTSLTSTITKVEVDKPQKDTTVFVYTGKEQTYTIVENSLYTVSNNKKTNADKYDVTISLVDKTNYKWKESNSNDLTYDFIINKADMAFGTNYLTPSVPYFPLEYDGEAHELLNSGLTFDEKDNSEFGTFYYSKDGTSWSDKLPTAIASGEYNPLWYFVGDNNHNNVGSSEEPITQLYPVVISSSGALTLSSITDQVYTGREIKPTVTINGLITGEELTLNTDYAVSYIDNIDVGTATVTVTLLNTDKAKNYEFAEKANIVTFNITPKPLTDDALVITGTYTYTGSLITPTYKVKDGSKELVKDSDFTAVLTNNTNASTTAPTVTITLKGNYSGTLAKTFAINKAPITPAVLIDSWTQDETANDPSVTGNTDNGTVTYQYKVKDANDSTYTSEKPSTAGNYVVKATIADTDNYLGNTATCDFVIFNTSTTKDGNIETAILNINTEVKDAAVKSVTKEEAEIILNKDIEATEDVIIYAEINEPSEESKDAFILKNITTENAVILDINLFTETVGEANSKKQIVDTNGQRITISITLTPQQASVIGIAGNKNYFVLRQHNDVIDKIPATLTTDVDGNHIFTFETDKFSTYAIYSENKPVPYDLPKTGVETTSNNNSLLKLSSLSLLAIGTYIAIKKKKDNE